MNQKGNLTDDRCSRVIRYRAAGRLAADPFDSALGKKAAHGFLSGERAGREEGKKSPLQDGELLA
jgi:hypothetical protein